MLPIFKKDDFLKMITHHSLSLLEFDNKDKRMTKQHDVIRQQPIREKCDGQT